jgi:predicted transcriptional regulator
MEYSSLDDVRHLCAARQDKERSPESINSRLTLIFRRHTLKAMEVDFTPDLQAKLTRLAAEQGRDTKAIVREAVERFVDYDEWFLREVEKGLAAADRGEFMEHDDVSKLIDSRYPA